MVAKTRKYNSVNNVTREALLAHGIIAAQGDSQAR